MPFMQSPRNIIIGCPNSLPHTPNNNAICEYHGGFISEKIEWILFIRA